MVQSGSNLFYSFFFLLLPFRPSLDLGRDCHLKSVPPFDYTTDPHTDPKNGNRGNVSTALKVKATLGTISQRPLGFTVDETSAPSLCMGRCCLKVRNRIDDVNTSSLQHHITIKRFPAILSALQKNHRCGLWTPS